VRSSGVEATGWLAAGRGRLWLTAGVWRAPLVRLGSLEYFGLRGEGSTPVPLPPTQPNSPNTPLFPEIYWKNVLSRSRNSFRQAVPHKSVLNLIVRRSN
jgi:hypothetical protein